MRSQNGVEDISLDLARSERDIGEGDLQGALDRLEQLRQRVRCSQPSLHVPWRARDQVTSLGKLGRGLRLAEASLIPPPELSGR